MLKLIDEKATCGADAVGETSVSARPFGTFFFAGLAKISCLLIGAVACWQVIYGIGWSATWLLNHLYPQFFLAPSTVWIFASDSDPTVVITAVAVLGTLDFITLLVLLIARVGGWPLPACLDTPLFGGKLELDRLWSSGNF